MKMIKRAKEGLGVLLYLCITQHICKLFNVQSERDGFGLSEERSRQMKQKKETGIAGITLQSNDAVAVCAIDGSETEWWKSGTNGRTHTHNHNNEKDEKKRDEQHKKHDEKHDQTTQRRR